MITLEDRAALFEKITDLPGLGATSHHDLAQRQEYCRRLFPNDDQKEALASAHGMSCCMLVVMAFWREAGVRHPLLDTPYFKGHIGLAPSWVEKIARDLGAYRDPLKADYIPQCGDATVIGSGQGLHGFVVSSYTAIDGKLRSIDGGQGERNSEITWRDRRVGWDDGSKKYWTYRGDTIESRDRPVTYWVDLGAMLP